MTLPTVQPMDWPDWGTAPAYQLNTYADPSETVTPLVVADLPCGYSNYVTIFLTGDGDGGNQEWSFGWYTASQSEGGSLLVSQTVIRPFQYNITIPMSAYAPNLLVTLNGSTTSPFAYTLYITQMNQLPQVVGYPGGTRVMDTDATVAASSSTVFIPNGCAPGEHELHLKTTGTSWAVTLRQWNSTTTQTSIIIGTGAAAGQTTIRFIPPVTGWDIEYNNLNAGDDDILLTINRLP